MPIRIVWIIIIISKIPTHIIVNKTVAIIVKTIDRICRVAIYVISQILMIHIYTRIEDAYNHCAVSSFNFPSFIGFYHTEIILKAPVGSCKCIIGNTKQLHLRGSLSILDKSLYFYSLRECFYVCSVVYFYGIYPNQTKA